LQGPLRDHQVAVMAIAVIDRPLSVVERETEGTIEER